MTRVAQQGQLKPLFRGKNELSLHMGSISPPLALIDLCDQDEDAEKHSFCCDLCDGYVVSDRIPTSVRVVRSQSDQASIGEISFSGHDDSHSSGFDDSALLLPPHSAHLSDKSEHSKNDFFPGGACDCDLLPSRPARKLSFGDLSLASDVPPCLPRRQVSGGGQHGSYPVGPFVGRKVGILSLLHERENSQSSNIRGGLPPFKPARRGSLTFVSFGTSNVPTRHSEMAQAA